MEHPVPRSRRAVPSPERAAATRSRRRLPAPCGLRAGAAEACRRGRGPAHAADTLRRRSAAARATRARPPRRWTRARKGSRLPGEDRRPGQPLGSRMDAGSSLRPHRARDPVGSRAGPRVKALATRPFARRSPCPCGDRCAARSGKRAPVPPIHFPVLPADARTACLHHQRRQAGTIFTYEFTVPTRRTCITPPQRGEAGLLVQLGAFIVERISRILSARRVDTEILTTARTLYG